MARAIYLYIYIYIYIHIHIHTHVLGWGGKPHMVSGHKLKAQSEHHQQQPGQWGGWVCLLLHPNERCARLGGTRATQTQHHEHQQGEVGLYRVYIYYTRIRSSTALSSGLTVPSPPPAHGSEFS